MMNIDMLEKLERRTTQLILVLRYLLYEERLRECDLTILEMQISRGMQL